MTPTHPEPDDDAPRAGTLVVGVLGGIASGKSLAARLLSQGAAHGADVIRADDLAHEVLREPDVVALVRGRFGDGVLGDDGLPDRAALAAAVFAPESGDQARAELEDWIHPRVRARILERLSEARAAGARVCVLDVPLLLENDAQHGLVRECDVLVFVECDEDERALRALRDRNWTSGEISRRESLQLPLDEKRRRADYVLQNNGSRGELESAIRELRETLGLPSNP